MRSVLAGLPLAFSPNLGQAPDEVRFQAMGAGYTLHLADDKVVLVGQTADVTSDGDAPEAGTPQLVRFAFPGATGPTDITGEEKQPGVVNHYIGNDPDKWVEGASTFARVRYADLYPGIDLVFYATASHELEFDFEVAPGADPDRIAIAVDGAPTRLDNGQVLIEGPAATFTMDAPIVYQEGTAGREPVEAMFLLGDNVVRFDLASYDASRTLVIDPVVSYGAYLGGPGSDEGWGVAVDPVGNIYVTGWAAGGYPTFDAYDGTLAGANDVFVTKLSPDGSTILYSTYIGGGSDERSQDIDVTSSGDAYIVGHSRSINYPTLDGYQSSHPYGAGSYWKPVMTRLDPAGQLHYSTFYGGTIYYHDYGRGIDAREDGVVAFVGQAGTGCDYFPITWDYNGPGTSTTTRNNYCASSALFKAFIAVIDTEESGSASRLYAAIMGTPYYNGNKNSEFGDVAWNADDHAVAVGWTVSYSNSADQRFRWRTTPDAYRETPYDWYSTTSTCCGYMNRGKDGVVAVFDPSVPTSDASLVYSTYVGGGLGSSTSTANRDDELRGVAVDADGLLHLVGWTESADHATTAGAVQASRAGGRDIMYWVLDPTAGTSGLKYATYLGGSGLEEAQDVRVHPTQGGVVVTGHTQSSDFPTTADAYQDTYGGGPNDMFFTWIDWTTSGSDGFTYSTYIGGAGDDVGRDSAVTAAGQVWVSGRSNDAGLPVADGTATQSDDGAPYDGATPKGGLDAALVGIVFNRPPEAVDDDAPMDAHIPSVLVDVTYNDSDPDPGDPPTVSTYDAASSQGYGTITLESGKLRYTLDRGHQDVYGLDAGEALVDTFTYKLKDQGGETDTATVTITIDGVDEPEPAMEPFAVTEANSDPGGMDFTVITTSVLDARTPQGGPAGDATFELVAPLPLGDLKVDGTAAAVGGTFDRADLLAGRITYRAPEYEPSDYGFQDGMRFKLYDDVQDPVDPVHHQMGAAILFPITVHPWDDPPVPAFTASATTTYEDVWIRFTDTSVFGDAPITAYAWDFGDGATATGTHVQHPYTTAGTYDVTLTVTEGAQQRSVTQAFTILPYMPPVVEFLISDDRPVVGQDVTFTDITAVGALTVESRRWDFDGPSLVRQDNDVDVVMAFPAPGSYEVTLTVTDALGREHSGKHVVVVGDDATTPPEEAFQVPDGMDLRPRADAGPDQVVLPNTRVPLHGAATPSLPETTYQWSHVAGPQVTFEAADKADAIVLVPSAQEPVEVMLQLVVVQDGLASEPDTVRLVIDPEGRPSLPPAAPVDPAFDVDVAATGLATFTASPGAAVYEWDFGDGTSEVSQAATTHRYTSEGVFRVKLRVVDAAGFTEEWSRSVSVGPDAPGADRAHSFTGHGSHAWPWFVLGALVVVCAGAGLFVWRRIAALKDW